MHGRPRRVVEHYRVDSRRLRKVWSGLEDLLARWLMRIWILVARDFFFLPAASVEPVDYIKLVSEPRSLCIHHRRSEGGREREREKRGFTFRLLREGESLDLETDQLVVVAWFFFWSPFCGRTYNNLLATALTFEETPRSSWSLMIPCSSWWNARGRIGRAFFFSWHFDHYILRFVLGEHLRKVNTCRDLEDWIWCGGSSR